MELKNFIWKFVSKDKFKPAMCGVYMDPEEKAAVATDAQVMLVCHELYDPQKADMIVYKDGHAIKNGDYVLAPDGKHRLEAKYPRWKSGIPKDWWNRDTAKGKSGDNYFKPFEEVFVDAWFKDRVSVVSKLTKTVVPCLNAKVLFHKRTEFWVQPRFARMMMSWGLKGWYISHCSRPAINKRSNGDFMLVMPMMRLYDSADYFANDYGVSVHWSTQEQVDFIKKVIEDFDLPIL